MTRRGQKKEGICGQPAMMSSFDMAQKWVNHSSTLPTIPDSSRKRCCCGQICPKDNITTYKSDFQGWKLSHKRQPYKLLDNFKVFQGVSLLNDEYERQPIQNKTSYKSSFIPHQLESMRRLDKAAIRSSIQLGEPARCGHYISDSCNGMVNQFKTWTLERKFPSSGKDNLNRFLSTTHADYIQHTLQRTKPIVQARQSSHRSKAPFECTTTMREDFKKWDLPCRLASEIKDGKKEWKKSFDQSSFPTHASEANHCPRCVHHKDRRQMKYDMDKDQARMVSCRVSMQN